MPHKPYWYRELGAIRRWAEAIQEPFVDRQAIESLFRVGQTEAQRLLKRMGAEKVGTSLIVPRWKLLDWLERAGRLEESAWEQERVGRLELRLEEERRHLAARRVAIQPVPETASIQGLPAGIHLKPGRLEIDYFGTEDLLKHLYALAQAIMADYPRFQKICEGD